jgi:hypothetical protein
MQSTEQTLQAWTIHSEVGAVQFMMADHKSEEGKRGLLWYTGNPTIGRSTNNTVAISDQADPEASQSSPKMRMYDFNDEATFTFHENGLVDVEYPRKYPTFAGWRSDQITVEGLECGEPPEGSDNNPRSIRLIETCDPRTGRPGIILAEGMQKCDPQDYPHREVPEGHSLYSTNTCVFTATDNLRSLA